MQCTVKIQRANRFHNNELAVPSVHNVSEHFGRQQAARPDTRACLFVKTFAKIILNELSKMYLLAVLFNCFYIHVTKS